MDSESNMDRVIGACITAVVAIALITTLVIPTSIDMITTNLVTSDLQKWNTLLYAVITMACVGTVVGVIRYFTNSKR